MHSNVLAVYYGGIRGSTSSQQRVVLPPRPRRVRYRRIMLRKFPSLSPF